MIKGVYTPSVQVVACRSIGVEQLEVAGHHPVIPRCSAKSTISELCDDLELERRRHIVENCVHGPGNPKTKHVHTRIQMKLGNSKHESVLARFEPQRPA